MNKDIFDTINGLAQENHLDMRKAYKLRLASEYFQKAYDISRTGGPMPMTTGSEEHDEECIMHLLALAKLYRDAANKN